MASSIFSFPISLLLLWLIYIVYIYIFYTFIYRAGDFNYDNKLRGATAKPAITLKHDKELSDNGFLVNHARVLVGSGLETFEKGKTALQNWRSWEPVVYMWFITY